MNLPVSVVITGCESLAILQQALEAAGSFTPMNDEVRLALLARSKKAAAKGKYELYKTQTGNDGTVHSPQWLG